MRTILWGVVCMTVTTGMAAAAEVGSDPTVNQTRATWAQVGPMRVQQVEDVDLAKREFEGLHAWLTAEQVVEGVERPLVVRLTQRELEEVESGSCEGCFDETLRLRVGIAKSLPTAVALETSEWGAGRSTADGGRVWSAAVRSEGAYGLRLHFSEFRLPVGAELYLYNAGGRVFGPYVGDGPLDSGEFWSHMVPGDTVYLQLRLPGHEMVAEQGPPSAVLVGVGHVGSRLGSAVAGTKAFCDYNATCVVNLDCVAEPAAVEVARDAVAHMQFVDEPYLYACSGGLINNTEQDGTPYFLTANHCLRTDDVAATLETYFQWSVDCGATCPEQWGTPIGVPSVLGASVVQASPVGDYTLLLLSGETAPPGTALLGWTSEPVAFTDEVPLYRVSHPAGAPQAYSEHEVDLQATTCLLWPRGSWIYSSDVYGATEGGSSGSPVVNGAGQVVGQLSGACGLLARFPCARWWSATVDGAFAGYYDEVAPWLDPSSVCSDDVDGDGYIAAECGGLDCDDDDFFVNPGVDEVCDNGIDDDCDLAVDSEDPDCAVCLDRGMPCTRGSDCCSGRCRWLLRICR